MSTTEDTFVISAYTRKEALVDGEQICLSEQCPEGCAMYKYPVYATRAVWTLIQEAVSDEELRSHQLQCPWTKMGSIGSVH